IHLLPAAADSVSDILFPEGPNRIVAAEVAKQDAGLIGALIHFGMQAVGPQRVLLGVACAAALRADVFGRLLRRRPRIPNPRRRGQKQQREEYDFLNHHYFNLPISRHVTSTDRTWNKSPVGAKETLPREDSFLPPLRGSSENTRPAPRAHALGYYLSPL